MSLGKFTQQPSEVKDYNVSFADYLTAAGNDTISDITVTADEGITTSNVTQAGGVVNLFVSGGTSGQTYKVTVSVETSDGRMLEADFHIKVKEQ